MPLITVELFAGRDTETKRKFVERVTAEACEVFGCKPEAVHVIFKDIKPEDWATGGVMWSDKK
ncbi:4-oxalocrotonate tautomerase [Paenalcaligenes hominis]|uniref:4-oxalocrotonate tautomerase n=1 Tax=Paenalcaligenes hominis TaxID=643674 RepID=UPI0035243D7D